MTGKQPFASKFDLNDFRRQIERARETGLIKDLYAQLEGTSLNSIDKLERIDFERLDHEHEIRRLQGIIDSMTADERNNPRLINASRRRRIARGAGVNPLAVGSLVNKVDRIVALLRQVARRLEIASPHAAAASAPIAEDWPNTEDRLALFSVWNRNLALWEFIADS
jgi:signal recognition particle subunit SRP54